MGLQNICRVSNMSLSEKIEINLISMFDWGFIDHGGYINVNLNQSGDYVDNLSVLHKIVDPRGFTKFQGPKNWVYEESADSSGVNCPPTVYVASVLNTGVTINYRDGSVTGISSGATDVRAEFSYKWVTFTSTRKVENLRRVQYRQNRTDLGNNENKAPSEIRIPMPFVAFDVPPISESYPYGLGLHSPKVYNHDIVAYVVGETQADVTRICDMIAMQEGYLFNTFDPQLVHESGDYPLNFNGTLNSGKNHDELVVLYPWATLRINSAECLKGAYIHEHIYQASISLSTTIVSCGCP